MNKRYHSRAAIILLTATLLASTAQAALQSAALVVDTPIRAQPNAASAVVANLSKNAVVGVGERQGGWYSVEAQQGKGWIRMVTVRFVGMALPEASNTTAPISNRHSNDGAITVATGIRGLSEQDLESAVPDHVALAAVLAYQLSESEVKQFAQEGGLEQTP